MFLDYFALAVLVILVAAGVTIWVLLGIMPGRIARDRNHPQADAISVCGWWGVLTMRLTSANFPVARLELRTSTQNGQHLPISFAMLSCA